jgi:metal-responsive CopG/Arc/MetJ family transcriptional regulator
MSTRKTAIAIPEELLSAVDRAAEAKGESRSRYITNLLRIAMKARRDAEVTHRLNELFASEVTADEQRRDIEHLDELGSDWTDERW